MGVECEPVAKAQVCRAAAHSVAARITLPQGSAWMAAR